MTHTQTQGADGAGTKTAGQVAHDAYWREPQETDFWNIHPQQVRDGWERAAAAVAALASPRADSAERTAGAMISLPLDDPKRSLNDSGLPSAMIWAGGEAYDNLTADKTIDLDSCSLAVGIYRAMTETHAKEIATLTPPVGLKFGPAPATPPAVPDSLRALSEAVREVVRAARKLGDQSEDCGDGSQHIDADAWRYLTAAIENLEALIPENEYLATAEHAVTLLLKALASHPAGQSAGSGAEAHTVFDPARTTSDPYDDRPGPWYDMKKVREIEAATGIAFAVAPLERDPSRATDGLVERFAEALRTKLRAAEAKYGWQNGWLKSDWAADCQRDLMRHVGKGDPLDVAAYAAFCWHHGWPTAPDSTRMGQGEATDGWVLVPLECTVEMIRAARARAREMLGGALNALAFEDCWDAALAARPAAPEAQGLEREGFNAGYAMACANIVNLHGEDTIAEDVLAESGITLAEVKALGLTDYDMKPLRALFREIARKRKISKAKPAPPASSGQGGR